VFKLIKFAVLGAGNGGQAMAAYLALKGYRVNLYNRGQERIKYVKERGGIQLSGIIEGFGKLDRVTTYIEEAIRDVEVIMIVAPAIAHKYLAEKLSPYLRKGQIIILNPGRTGGALEFNNILRDKHPEADVIIAEAQTFLFASRITGDARAKIFGIKNKVAIAAFPSTKTRQVIDKISPAFPQFTAVENVLKTSLDNIGAVFHPTPTLLNMAWIESTGGEFNYYQQGISPAVASVIEKIDEERRQVAYRLGIDPISASDWLRMSYGVKGKNLYELLQNNNQYHEIGAPSIINHRYIFEDVPMSLVPIASLGRMFNVKTPTIEMVINLANLVFKTDFRETGRTVESLGIKGLNSKQILNLVNIGYLERDNILPQMRRSFYNNLGNLVYEKYMGGYQKEAE
jgi:opine dehydrogenase